MSSTSGWAQDSVLKLLIGTGVFIVYLGYLVIVAILMQPTLEAIRPLL